MGCPPVRGDNPRALASGLSYVQVDKHGIKLFYTTYISVNLAHHEIFGAKVGKGGIKAYARLTLCLPCYLLITFANSLEPDQAQPNVGPDLDPNCLTL